MIFEAVQPRAARRDLPVLRRQPAERDETLGVREDLAPFRDVSDNRVDVAEHVRQQHHRGAEAIVRRLQRRAAGRPQEAVQERARVVQTAGAGPAVRAAEDRGVAVTIANARDFARDEIERFVPRNGDERVVAAHAARRTARRIQPTGTDHRFGHPVLRVYHLRPRVPNPQAKDRHLQDRLIAACERLSSVALPD